MSVNYSHISLLEGVLFDPIGLMGNPHYRKDAEIGAAVAACIFVDVASAGSATWADGSIMAEVAGTTSALGGPVATDAIIGGVSGGFIGARGGQRFSMRGAVDGALMGASLGYATNFFDPQFSLKAAINTALTPSAPSWCGFGAKVVLGGVGNTAFSGSGSNEEFFNNFGYGAIAGALSFGADSLSWKYCGMGVLNGVARVPSEIIANAISASAFGNPKFGASSVLSPAGSWLAFDITD